MISTISVKNVKGIKNWTFSFSKPEMLPNKVHVLIAPNGFGKSSITRAFDCLNQQRLNLKEKDCYLNDESNQGELSLNCQLEGSEYNLVANQSQNQIGKHFDTWVIRAPSKVKASQRPTSSGFQVPVGEFVIEDIELRKIPEKHEIPYRYRDHSSSFGTLGKAIPNISAYLTDFHFLERLSATKLGEKAITATIQRKIDNVASRLQQIDGSRKEILEQIESNFLAELKEIKGLEEVSQLFSNIELISEKYLAAIGILSIHHSDRSLTKKASDWLKSEDDYRRVKETIKTCNHNPGWLQPSVQRSKGKLVVKLPKPEEMSNGQRDFLCFISHLLRFEIHNKKKRRILIIDEVFDYLDYSNIVACQYYLKKFIDRERGLGREIYPWIFTHLDPSVFNSFIFSKKIQKNHFLDKTKSVDHNTGICKIIKIRDSDEALRVVFNEYHAHHSLSECDEKQLFKERGLKMNWGCSATFKSYCANEAKKYINEVAGEVDYLATCLHVRITIERMACVQLSAEEKNAFIATRKTVSKLDKAHEFGADIPELHYLLAGLMNTALHDTNPHADFVSPVISKLKNHNIRAMIREVLTKSAN